MKETLESGYNNTNPEHGIYYIQEWGFFRNNALDRLKNSELKTYEQYKDELVQFMRRYAEDKFEFLDEAYRCYKDAISREFTDSSYVLLDEYKLKKFLPCCKVLIITANSIEKAMLHFFIAQKDCKIRRIICGTNAYFIFKWGAYWVAHVQQPQTGSFKDLGLNTTVNEALKYFKPNVILSLGVAFGIDFTTQHIGDVIVSRKIYPYSENKRDEEEIKPDRTQDKTIDNWLDIRFTNVNGFLDGVTYGGVLSGGIVMSSFVEKDRVCTAYSKDDYIVGGEMEGSALFQISNINNIPCAVIKGICDWGVAKNNIFGNKVDEEKFKNSLQAYAMKNVIEKCELLFRDSTIFSTSKTRIDEIEKKNRHLIGINILSNMYILIISLYLINEFHDKFKIYFGIGILGVCLSIIAIFFSCKTFMFKRKNKILDLKFPE